MPEQDQGAGTQEQQAQQQTNQDEEVEENDDDPTTWKPERAAKTIKAQREAEAKLKQRLAAAEERAKNANKTAEQKTAERLSLLEARVVTSDVKEALTKAGAINSVVAAKLVDRADLNPESTDYEARITAAIKEVKAEAPELFKNTNSSGSADQGARGKTGPADMNSLIRSKI